MYICACVDVYMCVCSLTATGTELSTKGETLLKPTSKQAIEKHHRNTTLERPVVIQYEGVRKSILRAQARP